MMFVFQKSLAISAAIIVGIATSTFAQDAFSAADASGDGALDRNEFTVFIKLAAQAGKAQAKKVVANNYYSQAFVRIDKNKDGLISPGEISAMR